MTSGLGSNTVQTAADTITSWSFNMASIHVGYTPTRTINIFIFVSTSVFFPTRPETFIIYYCSKQKGQQTHGSIRAESSENEKCGQGRLEELKGWEERSGARYSNRFRRLTLTASRLDNQHCLLAKDEGWETGREGDRRSGSRGGKW